MIPVILLVLALSPHTARQRPVGSTVTVEGFVTLQSGAFRAVAQDNGFVLGNTVTGIYVPSDKSSYYSLGTMLEVKGTLEDNGHGLLVLRPMWIRRERGHGAVRPEPVTLGQVNESTEGRIVQVEGTLKHAAKSIPEGYQIFVHGDAGTVQVFVPNSVKLDPALVAAGASVRISGWVAQHEHIYVVVVRNAHDIKGPKQ